MRRFPKGTVSLERALSKLGIASRTEARRLILARHVSVDGQPVRDPLAVVNPDRARIEVDGRPIARVRALVIALNKPAGVVTTRKDELGRRTVYDLLPRELPFVGPIGRLDFESSGLLLLTNDTRLADLVATPGGCAKVYDVEIDRPFSQEAITTFRAGMQLEDGPLLEPVEVDVDPQEPRRARFVLREGRNRQIRRMCGGFGWSVLRLHRVAVGPIVLGDLGEGAWRELGVDEVAALRQ